MRIRRSFLALALALIFAPILARQAAVPARAADPCAPGERYFAETGFCVSALFSNYWDTNGGLAQQGLPLSKEFDEVNAGNGKTYRVQYFERSLRGAPGKPAALQRPPRTDRRRAVPGEGS
jgi:hypothetical protein